MHDPVFRESIRHTVVYTVLFVPITLVSSLLVAAALNRRLRGISLYRLAVFVPVVTSTVATGVIFTWLLDPDYGIVNAVLDKLGLPQQRLLRLSRLRALHDGRDDHLGLDRVRRADLPRRRSSRSRRTSSRPPRSTAARGPGRSG